MTSLANFYALAAAVTNPRQRRWVAGAAYRLGEAVRYGDSIATARTRIMSVPQYANGLVAAGLDDDFALIDDVGGGVTVPLSAGTILQSTTSLVAGGLA